METTWLSAHLYHTLIGIHNAIDLENGV